MGLKRNRVVSAERCRKFGDKMHLFSWETTEFNPALSEKANSALTVKLLAMSLHYMKYNNYDN